MTSTHTARDSPRLAALLRRVRTLEISAERNVSSLLSGNYRTTFRGQGLDFHEARKYIPGDAVRRIDWRMTARMREAYIRVHNEERQRELLLAVDVSPSMATGWQQRNKLETAIEVAATLALAAVRAGDRLGYLLFHDKALHLEPPSRGRLAFFLLLRRLLEAYDRYDLPRPGNNRENVETSVTDIRSAIHAIQNLRGRLRDE